MKIHFLQAVRAVASWLVVTDHASEWIVLASLVVATIAGFRLADHHESLERKAPKGRPFRAAARREPLLRLMHFCAWCLDQPVG